MPIRLDVALIRRHPALSRRRARDVIEKGQVAVEGRLVRDAGLMVGEQADVAWDPHRKALPRARARIPILHADADVLVVDKPAGLLSVPSAPGATDEDTALGRVQDYVAHLTPRHPYVGLVHRLDRETSGALAFALSPAARGSLIALFRDHRIVRRYAAIVEGDPRADTGVVDAPIHEAYAQGRRRVARPGEPARTALTLWRVEQRLPGAALLDIALDTGRQHQIRVHLAHVGMPILGDPVYGRGARRPTLAVARQMLHARLLGFRRPTTGEDLRVSSPLPPDFVAVLRQLRSRRR